MIAIDLSKQQVLDADPKTIQQIDFTRNLGRIRQTSMYFIIEEAKKARNCESIVILFCFNIILI